MLRSHIQELALFHQFYHLLEFPNCHYVYQNYQLTNRQQKNSLNSSLFTISLCFSKTSNISSKEVSVPLELLEVSGKLFFNFWNSTNLHLSFSVKSSQAHTIFVLLFYIYIPRIVF